MTMIGCPECTNQVSDQPLSCNHCGIQLRKPTRSFLGKTIKFLFIAFNVIMGIWLISYFGTIGEAVDGSLSEAEAAGAAVGGTIGTGLLLTLWVLGDIILGILTLLTRPKS